MILYGLKNCDTCRKALKSMAEDNIEVVFKDIRAENLATEIIADWWAIIGAGLLNRRSTTWRNLTESEQSSDPVALMHQNPSLIKRPVMILDNGAILCGWNKDNLDEIRKHT